MRWRGRERRWSRRLEAASWGCRVGGGALGSGGGWRESLSFAFLDRIRLAAAFAWLVIVHIVFAQLNGTATVSVLICVQSHEAPRSGSASP